MKTGQSERSDNRIFYRLGLVLVWAAVWEILALLVDSELILPGPVSTLKALSGLIVTGEFWMNVIWTMLRVALGIVISFAAGCACASIASRNRAFREFISLPVSFFKSIPVMAIIIYVILVVKADWVAVVVCFFMCFPISYTNILNGLLGVRKEYDELGTILGMNRHQKRVLITMPQLKPGVRSSLDLITGMSWKVVVASEVLAIPKHSIGYQMLNSKYYLDTPELFSYIIVLIVLSAVLGKVVSFTVDMLQNEETKSIRKMLVKPEGQNTTGSDEAVKVELKGVSKCFDSADGTHKEVLQGLDMDLEEGITALAGPSGRGKTTVARLISGLEVPDSGTVSVKPRYKTAVLFQEDRLLPWLTVEENMMTAFLGRKEDFDGMIQQIKDMAEKLEIEQSLTKYPEELSGGMAHRAAIGRALLSDSRLMILDEPFRGLDEDLRDRIIDKVMPDIRRNREGLGRTVLLISHDMEVAESISDKMIRLE